MSLRRRVLLGCLVVAAVLLSTDAVLASTFRAFLLGRVDQQVAQAADPLVHGRFRGSFAGRIPSPSSNPTGEQRVYTEYYIGLAAADGTVSRLGPGLRENDQSAPKVSASAVAGHLSPSADDLRPFTVPSSTGGGQWRVVVVQRTGGDDGTLIFGARLNDMDATLGRMLTVEGVATVLVLAALAAMALWVLRLGVRPLAHMAETAGAIAAGDLSQRVEHADDRTEAGQLGTALNAMMEQIEEAFDERAATEERLRQFVADASHELRTPLTSIRGYAELWRAGGLREAGDVGEAMRRMEQEARRMGLLVDDLLLLARLDQGRPLETAPLAFDRLVDDAVRDARAVEPDRPIDLTAEAVTVVGDDHRLRQVIGNLLANARLHTPPGTPVHVSLRAGGDRVRLEVADEGPGLAPEVAARVFERFYRGDPARTRARGGSGLGLSIVAAVAEAHGGRVSVDTAPGAGARFVVDLPLQEPRIKTSVASGT
ncbi:MAG TPA: HAMP domain-containing sensor histidine kinase [Acidimicrobiia bacterium]|nr:HAMP domain-containing sensor histidine kinase [Acidimicrobiia bacterium]